MTTEEQNRDDYVYEDEEGYLEDDEPLCHTCGGEGWVDDVAEESGRWGWDPSAPGKCPNCGGSGLLRDCTTF